MSFRPLLKGGRRTFFVRRGDFFYRYTVLSGYSQRSLIKHSEQRGLRATQI